MTLPFHYIRRGYSRHRCHTPIPIHWILTLVICYTRVNALLLFHHYQRYRSLTKTACNILNWRFFLMFNHSKFRRLLFRMIHHLKLIFLFTYWFHLLFLNLYHYYYNHQLTQRSLENHTFSSLTQLILKLLSIFANLINSKIWTPPFYDENITKWFSLF